MKPRYFAVFVEWRDDDGWTRSDWAVMRTREDAIGVLEEEGIDFSRVYYESGSPCDTLEEAESFIYGERFKCATLAEAESLIRGEQFICKMLESEGW